MGHRSTKNITWSDYDTVNSEWVVFTGPLWGFMDIKRRHGEINVKQRRGEINVRQRHGEMTVKVS